MIAYAFYDEDTRIMRYAESLARRGDEVDVIGLRRNGQPNQETLNGVQVFRIQTRPPNNGAKLSYLLGVLVFMIRASVRLGLYHLRKPYRLVHVHSVPDFLVFTAVIPKLGGARIILDIHDMLPEFYASKYGADSSSNIFKTLAWIEKMSAAFADHVIAANELWFEKLIKRSIKPTKCTSMVNVPDRAIFKREGRTRSDGKFILLYPGTLNWHQGVDLAIAAFNRIKDEFPGLEFHIYGEGPTRSALEDSVERLGLKGRVFIKGFLPTRAIARIMENADLGVVPKRKDGFGNEAFSTKIMEFMAMGVPVVVSDTRVDHHYFNDSIVQFFSGGNEVSLAESIRTLVKDARRREQLVERATEFVGNNDWEAMEPTYFALVDSLVGVTDRSRDDHVKLKAPA